MVTYRLSSLILFFERWTDESKHLEHGNEKYMDELKDYTETRLQKLPEVKHPISDFPNKG